MPLRHVFTRQTCSRKEDWKNLKGAEEDRGQHDGTLRSCGSAGIASVYQIHTSLSRKIINETER